MLDTVLGLFAPHRCVSCGENGAILCNHCIYNIKSEPYQQCVFCGYIATKNGFCKKCSPSLFTQGWCVGTREEILKDAIDQYKFDSQRTAAHQLALLLDETVPQLPPDVAIVGIPTSSRSRRLKGFDHIDLIVRRFAKMRHLERVYPLRREYQQSLHFLNKHDRTNLSDKLFSLRMMSVPPTILLIDDIVTTGTTVRAAAKLLKNAGAKQIYLAVIARQPSDH